MPTFVERTFVASNFRVATGEIPGSSVVGKEPNDGIFLDVEFVEQFANATDTFIDG